MASHDESLARLRSAIGSDQDKQRFLADTADWSQFIGRALELARGAGVQLTVEALRALRHDDPIGLARFSPPPSAPPDRPSPGWLPMQIVWDGGGLVADWLYFGDRPLRDSFFEFDVRAALNRPFNALFRFRTPASAIGDWPRTLPSLRPSGLIFHMSRCGSTLVARMLAASDANIVLSEAAPVDAALQSVASEDLGLLRDTVAALGQVRHGASRYFLKLEPWHALALPLFQRAFPDVPWIFLYRDPVEVMVSLSGSPAAQLAPSPILQHVVGGAPPGALGVEEEAARFLAAVCGQAATAAACDSRGMVVNYADLPQAFSARILPHFGVTCDPRERAVMQQAAAVDAKAPARAFAPDAEAKQRLASDEIRSACRAHLAAPYAALDALSGRRSGRQAR